MCNYDTVAVADTGADFSVISTNDLAKLGLQEEDLFPTSETLQAAGGQQLRVRGCVPACIRNREGTGNQRAKELLYIVDNVQRNYLSRTAMRDLASHSTGWMKSQQTGSCQKKSWLNADVP